MKGCKHLGLCLAWKCLRSETQLLWQRVSVKAVSSEWHSCHLSRQAGGGVDFHHGTMITVVNTKHYDFLHLLASLLSYQVWSYRLLRTVVSFHFHCLIKLWVFTKHFWLKEIGHQTRNLRLVSYVERYKYIYHIFIQRCPLNLLSLDFTEFINVGYSINL